MNKEPVENQDLEEADAVQTDHTVEEAVEESKSETGTDEAKDQEESGKKDPMIEKLEKKVAELEDVRVRQLAEFENFRNRSEKEKGQMFEIGAKSVIEKILPVVDNFERGLAGVPEEEKESPFVEGMNMIYKQILTSFEELGVKPIEAVGTEFNPNYHNAVMMVDDDEKESGTVSEELQKGYLYKDSVVRHSMVKVVN